MSNKKKRNRRKNENIKTKEDRLSEVNEMKLNLSNHGITDKIENIKLFYEYCDNFVNDNVSWSGKLKLPGLKRILDGVLTTKKTNKSSIVLKYDDSV